MRKINKLVITFFYTNGEKSKKIILSGQDWNCKEDKDEELVCKTLNGEILYWKNYKVFDSKGKRVTYFYKRVEWNKSGKMEYKTINRNQKFKSWEWDESGKLEFKW